MTESIKPVGEDFSTSIEDLAEFSGEVALEIYKTELDKGSNPIHAFSKAIDGAKSVMMDSGCPKEICDLLADAAINGYNSFIINNPDSDPMEAFDAAGDFINNAIDSEFVSK